MKRIKYSVQYGSYFPTGERFRIECGVGNVGPPDTNDRAGSNIKRPNNYWSIGPPYFVCPGLPPLRFSCFALISVAIFHPPVASHSLPLLWVGGFSLVLVGGIENRNQCRSLGERWAATIAAPSIRTPTATGEGKGSSPSENDGENEGENGWFAWLDLGERRFGRLGGRAGFSACSSFSLLCRVFSVTWGSVALRAMGGAWTRPARGRRTLPRTWTGWLPSRRISMWSPLR